MNRYPWWKYLIIAVVLALSALFALPNFFGEAPAVQISSTKATAPVDAALQDKVLAALSSQGISHERVQPTDDSLRVLFVDTTTQLKARDAMQAALAAPAGNAASPYVVALNLVRQSPDWLAKIAQPMYLGLDLRGGVRFLLQVDMQEALNKKTEAIAGDVRLALRDKRIRNNGIERIGQTVQITLADAATAEAARAELTTRFVDLDISSSPTQPNALQVAVKPESVQLIQSQAIKQNIVTLHNRINELGVAEPVIQQQGADRIVVELPGVQDTAKAKDILGRTATLEMRLVDVSAEGRAAAQGGLMPFGAEAFPSSDPLNTQPVIVSKQVIVTGDSLTDAQASINTENGQNIVNLAMDAKGGRIMRDMSRENIGKPMAIILFEKGKGEAISVATIQGELGDRFQISGSMSLPEAQNLALLLRAGSLAAPMDIIEENTVGPSLGKENIEKGFNSVMWGFMVIAVFMCIYYMLFGVFSSLALGFNLLMLVAILSLIQATLTLPGIAAMALALGMSIDSNVLINERIREELRLGKSPQQAIKEGFDHAWDTIFDSNITTLIAGLALFLFGSGAVKGFAVVHCIGILTSMFTAVFFMRGMVNWWYGSQKKLKNLSIGTVWKA